MPSSAIRAQPPAELLALLACPGRPPARRGRADAAARERAGHADELALALRELARASRRRPSRYRAMLERLLGLRGVARGPTDELACERRATTARSAATTRFSRTSRSSNSSVLCHVRARPRRDRACGGSRPRSCPSSSTRPVAGDEAGDRVDERRLAGAVRADQADQLARRAPRGRRSSSARTPPKCDREAADASTVASRAITAVRRRAASGAGRSPRLRPAQRGRLRCACRSPRRRPRGSGSA